MEIATQKMARVTNLITQFKQAELMLEEAQDSVNEFRCREMWDGHGAAMGAADEASEAVELACTG